MLIFSSWTPVKGPHSGNYYQLNSKDVLKATQAGCEEERVAT